VAQDENLATYDQKISRSDAQLDWQKPAIALEREVRAFAGWPRSKTNLFGKEVVITKAHVAFNSRGEPGETRVLDKEMGIYARDDMLAIDSLVPAGKSEMTISAFLAGYGK
jgi:methionyl-tRNA formyltransferase